MITRDARNPGRKWANRNVALSDLAAEGWVVEGPHPKEPAIRHDANRHFFGYALKRTIH